MPRHSQYDLMYRNETSALLLGLCMAISACDRAADESLGPDPVTLSEAVSAAAAPRANYIVVTLSKRPGLANGINAQGHVVGSYMIPGNTATHAFLWKDGVFRDLTPGRDYTDALAINDAGQVVGVTSGSPEGLTAFLWQNGVMRNLGTLGWTGGLGEPASVATSINSKGQIVGWSWTKEATIRAFLWEAGRMRRLPGLENIFSKAHGIDNNSRVVGQYGEGTTGRGFRWTAGAVSPVGKMGGGTVATAINAENKVVGWSRGNSRAFVWRAGVMTNLGTLGGTYSGASAINDLGQIVGYSGPPGDFPMHAFFWKNGVMYDVGPGRAKGINRNGWIVGERVDPAVTGHGNLVPTLWKPTATPPPPPAPGLIRVGNNFFASTRNGTWNPAVDTVAAGRTVTWSWFGGTHNVQSTGSPSFPSSAVMSSSQSKYTFTFSRAGTYQYNCVRHPTTMRGRVIVR